VYGHIGLFFLEGSIYEEWLVGKPPLWLVGGSALSFLGALGERRRGVS
jgi:hypothetical protein